MICRKDIKRTSTGMIIAKVYREDGTRCGTEFFSFPFDNDEKRYIKAHKWANKIIEGCKKYEIN